MTAVVGRVASGISGPRGQLWSSEMACCPGLQAFVAMPSAVGAKAATTSAQNALENNMMFARSGGMCLNGSVSEVLTDRVRCDTWNIQTD